MLVMKRNIEFIQKNNTLYVLISVSELKEKESLAIGLSFFVFEHIAYLRRIIRIQV